MLHEHLLLATTQNKYIGHHSVAPRTTRKAYAIDEKKGDNPVLTSSRHLVMTVTLLMTEVNHPINNPVVL